jgi:hypothetical protein
MGRLLGHGQQSLLNPTLQGSKTDHDSCIGVVQSRDVAWCSYVKRLEICRHCIMLRFLFFFIDKRIEFNKTLQVTS